MSAAPLTNLKHERYCLLIAAGFEPAEAHVRAGYTPDTQGGNATKLLARPEIAARISFLRGESSEPVTPSNEQAAITKELTVMAFDKGTPAAQRIRAFELLTEMNDKADTGDYWPTDADSFDLTRLSDKQRRLCELYASRPAQQSPAELILEKLAAIQSKSGKDEIVSESSGSKEFVSAGQSHPSVVFEETTSRSMTLTPVSRHGQR